MEKKIVLTKKDVVWHTSGNYDDTHDSQHCFKPVERKCYFNETYESSGALCNKNRGISEDGSTFLPIDKIESHELHRNFACRKCQTIYDKLPD